MVSVCVSYSFPPLSARPLLLSGPIERAGGILTLTDIYCLYNRARGTELVSPEDLVDACELLHTLKLGMHVRSFSSGVKVVQLDSHREEAVSDKIVLLLSGELAQRIARLFLPSSHL